MAETKATRRRNFRAARLRRKLRLRQAMLDREQRYIVSYRKCDLPETGHAVANAAGHPSPAAQGESTPETGAVFSDEAPQDDEGHDDAR